MRLNRTKIIRANKRNQDKWLSLRVKLWPKTDIKKHKAEIADISRKRNQVAFLASHNNRVIGFIECSIRKYAEDCKTDRIGFIEGWYVEKDFRKKGLGRKLVKTAEDWAKFRKCKEMASDCLIENRISFKSHTALGYKESSRVIHFTKSLR